MFEQRELDGLWSVIEHVPHHNTRHGLANASFSMELDDFAQQHYNEVSEWHKPASPSVTFDIPALSRELQGADIEFYHMCCVGMRATPRSYALSIHYRKNGRSFAVTVPGVGYKMD